MKEFGEIIGRLLGLSIKGLLFGAAAFGGVAIAQNFTAAVQLSQDPRGAFVVDSVGNFYLTNGRHLNAFPGASATPTVTGAGCVVTAGSTDFSGQLTACSGANGVVTFAQAYLTAPRCVASTSNATNVAVTVTTTTTALTITPNTAGAGTWNWVCTSVS